MFCAPDNRGTCIDWFNLFLQVICLIARLSFLTLLWRRSADERCFMLNAMAKIVAPVWFFWNMLPATTSHLILAVETSYHLSYVVVFFFAWLGIRGTLKLPFGPWLAEIVLSRVITCHVDSYQYSKMDSSSSDLRVMEQLSPDPFEQEEFRSDGSE